MAEKKVIEKKTVKKEEINIENNVTTKKEDKIIKSEGIAKEVEEQLNEKIENTINEIGKEISDVKAQEQVLMDKINENTENTKEILQNELERLDEVISKVDEKIENIENNLKKYNVFVSNSWNGWGYGE